MRPSTKVVAATGGIVLFAMVANPLARLVALNASEVIIRQSESGHVIWSVTLARELLMFADGWEPTHGPALRAEADLAARSGDRDTAVALLNASAAGDAFGGGIADIQLAAVYATAGDSFNSERALARASERLSASATELDLTYQALESNHPSAARRLLEDWTVMDPAASRPWQLLGDLDTAQSRPPAAVDDYARALARDPNNARYERLLGSTLAQDSQPALAESHLLRSISLQANESPWQYVALGNLARGQVNYEVARAWYSKGLTYFPDDYWINFELGVLDIDTGDLESAYSVLLSCADRDPTVSEVQYYLGETLLSLGRAGEAADRLNRAIRLNPQQPEYQAALTRAETAEAQVSPATTREPN